MDNFNLESFIKNLNNIFDDEKVMAQILVCAGCGFVKGPYRMAHPTLKIPGNELLRETKQELADKFKIGA